jgi:hypothetical protein
MGISAGAPGFKVTLDMNLYRGSNNIATSHITQHTTRGCIDKILRIFLSKNKM